MFRTGDETALLSRPDRTDFHRRVPGHSVAVAQAKDLHAVDVDPIEGIVARHPDGTFAEDSLHIGNAAYFAAYFG